MFRLSKQTDYSLVLLAHMAQCPPEATHTARELAQTSSIPLPMVGKILKALTRHGVLESHRGAKGGYSLSDSPDRVSIADIIQAMEGPVALTECSRNGHACCALEDTCPTCRMWQRINDVVTGALEDITLSDMLAPERPRRAPAYEALRIDSAPRA